MAAVTVKVVADTPRLGHGEIDANPSPDPKASKIEEADAATTAPAAIAGHDAADFARDAAGSAIRLSERDSMV
ncbi:MAG: hypothetical protein ABSF94_07870 [Steroidobacteraceae bacterium]|jgi:hypothetical protein